MSGTYWGDQIKKRVLARIVLSNSRILVAGASVGVPFLVSVIAL